MRFNEFVKKRMEPFAALKPPYGMKYEDMYPALGACLIELAGLKSGATKATELDWIQTVEGARVNQVCREAAENEECPTTTTLRSIWKRLFPPESAVRKECPRCHGEGFVVVDGPYGTSAAYPCSHKPETDADRRMGVRITPAVEGRYKREAVEAAARYRAGYKNLSAGDRGKFIAPAGVPQAILDAIGETE